MYSFGIEKRGWVSLSLLLWLCSSCSEMHSDYIYIYIYCIRCQVEQTKAPCEGQARESANCRWLLYNCYLYIYIYIYLIYFCESTCHLTPQSIRAAAKHTGCCKAAGVPQGPLSHMVWQFRTCFRPLWNNCSQQIVCCLTWWFIYIYIYVGWLSMKIATCCKSQVNWCRNRLLGEVALNISICAPFQQLEYIYIYIYISFYIYIYIYIYISFFIGI